ncbi:MAG: VOC family protein [Lachnospiraceae bacterium]|nr:VOC family protein [Lachnospiraceae bacterium]MBO5325873.1 VOC family protein [Lachnospiraceae bacterium]MBP3578482.1 VOC family protein [Lachnospiraceae bacterium]
MKFIQKLYFAGNTLHAIEKYKEAFGCTEKSVILYEDAVKNGWTELDPQREGTVYHSEIMFGDQEVRMTDTMDVPRLQLIRELDYAVGFRTAEEVKKAFDVLSRDGEIIHPLEYPPYMVIIGSVRDCFGIQWTLMCDFNY